MSGAAGQLLMRPIGQGHELIAIREATFERDSRHIRAIARQNTKLLKLIGKRSAVAERLVRAKDPNVIHRLVRHADTMFRVAIKRTLRVERHAREMERGR